MKTKIQKWGNSLGLRIPKSFAEDAAVEQGTTVDVSVSNGKLIIRAVPQKTYALEDLLRKVTKHNVHGEASFGQPEGQEAE